MTNLNHLDELLGRVKYLVAADGQVEGVVLDLETWMAIVELLEDLAIVQAIEARGEEQEAIPLDEALQRLRAEGEGV